MEINKFDNKFFTAGVKKQTPGLNKIAITPVDKALAFVIENFGEPLELDDLAGAAGISKFNLCRSFQRKLGITPMRWLWIFRTLLAGEFIKLVPSWSLTDIAFSCGFTSNAHFSRAFSAIY